MTGSGAPAAGVVGVAAEAERREEAASRTSAYVYGNILVLASLLALQPVDLTHAAGLAPLLATGGATLVAHVLAGLVGARVRSAGETTWRDVRHEIRDAAPIVTSTLTPALVLATALWHWLDPVAALGIAVGVTVLRLAALGWVIGHLRGGRASIRTVASGIVLAAVSLAAAVLKLLLTH